MVNAGINQTITLPSGAILSGTVTDDGLPNNTLTCLWTKVGGPGTVTFSLPTSLQTTATFSAPGSYLLQLAASDGALTSVSQVTVVVNATADISPPVISQVTASGITATGASITWTTSEPATSQVLYGTTPLLGSSSAADSTLTTAHSVSLASLSASTPYYYAVRSSDASGNPSTSPALTFSTLASTGPTAVFVTTDSNTQGNWKGGVRR